MSEKTNFSRRKFLKSTGIMAVGGAVIAAGSLAGCTKTEQQAAAPQQHEMAEPAKIPRGRMFFTKDLDFSVLSEAAERIFPADASGPGAKDLCVPYFIDNQLAGGYGYNVREYIQGPFAPGAPTQGYQTPVLKKDIFLQGVFALNAQANAMYKKDFPDLDDAGKDDILKQCEAGKLATEGFTSAYFFSLLRGMVLAGLYSDPIYMGNDGMRGWTLKEYPGAQMSYSSIIDSPTFQKIDPMSLTDMQ